MQTLITAVGTEIQKHEVYKIIVADSLFQNESVLSIRKTFICNQ
jgi:hypothetical protein